MGKLFQFTLWIWLLASTVFPASAAFSSFYVFGDGLSTTTDPTAPGYYGQRWSNGRVWVEVLAQRQGLTYDASKNNSYFNHFSASVVTNVNNFSAPPDVANDLFIVWVCNADTFHSASTAPALNLSQWAVANNLAQANHLQIITNLYAKGVRTLVMPNAVDISKIPAFNQDSSVSVMHSGCIDYNLKFSNAISQARVLCPGLKIYAPDFFTLLNNVLTNAGGYGLTNVTSGGLSIDAIDANNFYNNFPPAATNGFGTNFIFWDPQDPTAKFHAVIADVAQQLISPVQISKITPLTGSNRLDVANMPVGLNGFVDGSTNLTLTNWTSVQSFSSTNTVQSIFVPSTSPLWFYRLRFPYAWTWP